MYHFSENDWIVIITLLSKLCSKLYSVSIVSNSGDESLVAFDILVAFSDYISI